MLRLSLTLATGEPSYYIGNCVYVYGNLSQNGTLVQDGLVALEVVGPLNILTTRTVATNATPTGKWLVTVTDFFPCDESGNPETSFSAGGLSFFDMTVTNNATDAYEVLLTLTAYDESQAPLGVSSLATIVPQNSSFGVIMSLSLSDKAENGAATAYANVFSTWPSLGGKAYCPEKSSVFKITNGVTQPSVPPQNEQEGNYNMTFRLSREEVLGNYSIYATSMYQNGTASKSTQIVVKVQGDANGDGVVDLTDFGILERAWGSSPGMSNWDPRADFDQDGVVDLTDFGILELNWGYGT
jgi:hypothetical protein